jgi:hypothetical protein
VYVALALNPDGEKDVLWIEQNEGAKLLGRASPAADDETS